jgi:hypothetical protein
MQHHSDLPEPFPHNEEPQLRGHVHEKEESGQQMKMKKGNKTHQVAAPSRHTFMSGKGAAS